MSSISAVLPLNISESHKSNSCELADILLTSLKKFAAPDLFAKFFIICPPSQVTDIAKHMQKHPELPIEVLNEVDVVPELRNYPGVGGWRIQQIIKLQVAKIVPTPFYITFDADVVCTHPLTEAHMLPGGRALIQMEPRQKHRNWWLSSAYQLKVKPQLQHLGIFVTPAILAAEGVKGLIEEMSKNGPWMDQLMRPHMPGGWQKYLPFFKRKHHWTEYTLYHLFLERHGLVSRYHTDAAEDSSLMSMVSAHSVWKRDNFELWDESYCFSEKDRSLFVVIQSNKNIAPPVVRARLEAYIS